MTTINLQSGRVSCPKCLRKGVGYANHPHAFGHKDYGKASCRYCHATFKVVSRVTVTKTTKEKK